MILKREIVKKHVKCSNCGSVFYEGFADIRYDDLYNLDSFVNPNSDEGYGNYIDDCIDGNWCQIFRRLVKHVSKRASSLLDIGCASGEFLYSISEISNMQLQGVDIGEEIIALGKERYFLDLKVHNYETSSQDTKYDIITAFDIFEHVKYPARMLRNIGKDLNANGALILTVPLIDSLFARIMGRKWYLFIPPYHLNYFTKKSIKYFCNNNGFEIKSIKYYGKFYYSRHIFYHIQRKFPIFKAIYLFLLKNKIGKIKIYLNLFDVATIYAKKVEGR